MDRLSPSMVEVEARLKVLLGRKVTPLAPLPKVTAPVPVMPFTLRLSPMRRPPPVTPGPLRATRILLMVC